MYISLLISFIILSLSTYIIWPSRYNIPAHISLAFFFIAFLIPTLILPNSIANYDRTIIDLYTKIQLIGAMAYLFGMLFGYKLHISSIKHSFLWFKIPESVYCKKVSSITVRITKIAILGMIISFAVMGFIPIFASDPLAAKLLRGSYHTSYIKVAALYRSCNYILQFTIPLLLVLWYNSRKKIYAVLLVLSLLILIACFGRGPAFTGLVIGAGIIASYKKRLFKYYIFSLFFIYGFGSMAYYLIGATTYGLDSNSNIFEIIISGAPDIRDHLLFLSNFVHYPEYTYGRTFWGGLIPNHYYWNPAIWTLHIINSNDINEIISGGLRLSIPIWGYVSFSWNGVLLLSLIVGFLTGRFINQTQYLLMKSNNIIIQTVIILLYMKVYSFFINFYLMSIYNLPVLFIMMFYVYRFRKIQIQYASIH
jgi:hypothetical protein